MVNQLFFVGITHLFNLEKVNNYEMKIYERSTYFLRINCV